MRTLLIVHALQDWPVGVAGAQTVTARDYLTDPAWSKERGVRVFNLCRSYRYQTEGYYVSLLAAARRHRPFPGLMTILDMKSRALVRTVDEDLDALIQRSLADIRAERFELSIYFGRNVAERHRRLAQRLFTQFPAPLLRASFRHRKQRWQMTGIAPIAFHEVPDGHKPLLHEVAAEYLARGRDARPSRRASRYDLAILHDPREVLAPSDPRALARFRAAAREAGFAVEMIGRDDYGRLAEFDALFLRETTAIDHHTFRFAQRAEAEGLVVIDDPTSILRCTNKVYQAEAFALGRVPTPRTLILDAIDADLVEREIGFPCVLKFPDSAFSRGVVKCADRAELERRDAEIRAESELVLVQEFTPSDFDWRIGLFDGEPLYACRYYMARGHWQIVRQTGAGAYRYGRVDPVPLSDVPPPVLKHALRAARVIGDGLYGVDLKQIGRRTVVTEVNDNPNIDQGCEDAVLGKDLYRRIVAGLMKRVEGKKRGGAS